MVITRWRPGLSSAGYRPTATSGRGLFFLVNGMALLGVAGKYPPGESAG